MAIGRERRLPAFDHKIRQPSGTPVLLPLGPVTSSTLFIMVQVVE